MEVEETLVEISGWLGMLLLLLGYFLVSTRRLTSEGIWFHVLSLFGSLFVGINTLYHKAIPPTFLQVTFGLIAIYAITIRIRNKNAKT